MNAKYERLGQNIGFRCSDGYVQMCWQGWFEVRDDWFHTHKCKSIAGNDENEGRFMEVKMMKVA